MILALLVPSTGAITMCRRISNVIQMVSIVGNALTYLKEKEKRVASSSKDCV